MEAPMSPRTLRDVDALELGFLADGVLQAISATVQGKAEKKDLTRLKQGKELLDSIADCVGPGGVVGNKEFHLVGMNSFQYAADALKSVGAPKLSDGIRSYFASLAEILSKLISGLDVNPEDVDNLRRFFKALSSATLERWNANQGPALFGTEYLSLTEC